MKEQKIENNGFLKSAAWIAAGGFIAKIIGAVYRIPLTNLIGGHGLGLYQMVYPVYCLLLTVSATGIPSSIAKLTAERLGKGQSDAPVFQTALKLFLWIGAVGTVLMCVLAPLLSAAQGAKEVAGGYYTLAPSVFLVSAISVFRGWFQGRNNMKPTAVSEITEQAVKVGFGLLFAYLYRGNIQKAVVFLLLSVTISEAVALLVMFLMYKRVPAPHKIKNDGGRVAMKTVLKLSIPVTFSSMLLPLSGLLDSVLVPRLLSGYATDAVALYGLFSGGAVTIINLPVSICYGIAAASVPAVASAVGKITAVSAGTQTENNRTEDKATEGNFTFPTAVRVVRKKILFALGVTMLLGAVSAVGLYCFAEPTVKIIFRSLKGEELQILTRLIRIFSVSAFTLSCVQTLSACLTAQGKPQYAALSMLIAVTVKTLTYLPLLRRETISIFGLAHATNLCYLVAFLFDFLYNLIVSKRLCVKKEKNK